MNYCRLSAYIDLNSDGDFDDEGELLKVEGDKSSAGNNILHDYTLSVLLPYDIPEGITRIRLRFDGAWMVDNIDPTTDAMPAKAKTMRMVYDVPVNVTAHAATPCTVTVKTSDPAQGTVDANGQSETYTYAPGEDVILRCYPADGYIINHWKDEYGRALPKGWMEGNKIRFKPAESGTIYAVFSKEMPQTLTLGDWTFNYETNKDGITLTQVISGNGDLIIPESVEGVKIIAFAPGLLVGQEGLTSLTIPATMTDLGTAILASGNFKGAGVQGAALPIGRKLPAATAWSLNLQVKTNGNSFNAYGSALLATGTNPLADNYDRGFQLYLKKDGILVLKLGGSERKQFSLTKGVGEFSVNLSTDGTGGLSVVVNSATSSERFDEASYPLPTSQHSLPPSPLELTLPLSL